MKLYEGMFLVSTRTAKKDETAAMELITEQITRHGGEIVDASKWDDRKLAYPVEKQTRAVYFLVHFNAPEESVSKINFQCNLNTEILRHLILIDEDGVAEKPEAEETPAEEPVKEEAVAAASDTKQE